MRSVSRKERRHIQLANDAQISEERFERLRLIGTINPATAQCGNHLIQQHIVVSEVFAFAKLRLAGPYS